MSRFRTLTSRLVLTVVTLVAVVSLLIGAATTLVMRSYLTDQLDHDVRESLARTFEGPPGGGPPGGRVEVRNQAPGTLIAVVGGSEDVGGVVGARTGDITQLS